MDSETFVKVFHKRMEQLRSDIPNLTVEEARARYKALWHCCPVELHIDEFTLIRELEKQFPDFHIEGVNRRTFTIPVGKKLNWLTSKLIKLTPAEFVLTAFSTALLIMFCLVLVIYILSNIFIL
jgi:hypothetical protein